MPDREPPESTVMQREPVSLDLSAERLKSAEVLVADARTELEAKYGRLSELTSPRLLYVQSFTA